jgi:large subunit ribosomal protein L21
MEQIKTFDAYAIFETGGHQFFGVPGKTIEVEKLEGEDGAKLVFDKVLLRKTSQGAIEIGAPYLGTKVTATIVKQTKGPKLIAFRFKRRQKVRVKRGHRQLATVIRVESI